KVSLLISGLHCPTDQPNRRPDRARYFPGSFEGRSLNSPPIAAARSTRSGRPANLETAGKKNQGPANRGLDNTKMELLPIASATTTVLTATTLATGALFAGPGDIDRDDASANGLSIHPLYGLLRFFRRAHSDETEPARTARRAVHHQVGFSDCAVGGKRIL